MDNTLKAVCSRMAPADKQLLISKIVQDGVAVVTVYAYINGTRTPKKLYQIQIQKHIGRLTGQLYPLEELFPGKEE